MFNAGRAWDARPTSRAGTPTAVYPDGTDARTSEPAPILAKSPMSTLPNTVAPADSSATADPRSASLAFWRAAERDLLQHRYVFADDHAFTDGDTGAMVDK